MGARLSGVASIQRSPGVANQPFDSLHSFEGAWDIVNIETVAEVHALREDPNALLVKIPLWEATGVGGAEIVTYLRGRPRQESHDRAVIAIWTSGDSLWGTEFRP